MNYGYFHAEIIGIFYFFPSNNLTYRFFGYIARIIYLFFIPMNAFVEELKQLQVSPRNAPRNQQIKVAEKLIGLLCETATECIQIDDYDIDWKKVTLPSLYSFDGFSLRFLPFWWSCFVVLNDRQIDIRLPFEWENFDSYISKISSFAREYNRLPRESTNVIDEVKDAEHTWQTPAYKPFRKLSRRQELKIQFLKEMGPLVTADSGSQ